MPRARTLLALIMLAAVATAIYAAVLRWRVEMPNRTTALIVDWREVQALAAAAGVSEREAVEGLRDAGATHVAFSEEHLSDLAEAGQVTVLPMAAAGFPQLSGAGVVLSAYDLDTAERLRAQLTAKLSPRDLELPVSGAEAPSLLIPCRTSPAYLETLGLGWPDEAPTIVGASGLGVVARMDNFPGVSERALNFMAGEALAIGAHIVIFSRDQVLGYPGLIGDTAEVLQAGGLTYGSIELTKQLGDQRLGLALDGELIRVHSITEPEMLTMSPATAIERYTRAVRERGIRACYVRLFLVPRADLLSFNERYISGLKQDLAGAGYSAGLPHPVSPVSIPRWALMVMAAGAVAAAVFALGSVVPLAGWLAYLLFAIGLGLGAALFSVAPEVFRAEKALLAAIAFPSIALIGVARGARTTRVVTDVSTTALAGRAVAWLIVASLISVAGGLVVAGLLTDRLHMTQVLQFTGVKLALGSPMIVVAVVWILGLDPDGGWVGYRNRVKENFLRAWNRPIYVWEAVLAAALLGAAAAMLMRSGNQPGVEVSGLEMRARGILEQIFYARPRTKEFLVGHPALMLAVALALRGRTRWVLLFLLLGAIGQANLVNTFCHLHTPIFVSLLRSAHGLWLGLAIGAIAIWIWERLRGPAGAEMTAAQQAASGCGQPASGEEHSTGS
jgi:hypothetical protein